MPKPALRLARRCRGARFRSVDEPAAAAARADLDGRLARGIASIEREGSLSAYLNYREPGGLPDEREQAASWLAPRVPHARGERLVICPGTQNALFDFLTVQTAPGMSCFAKC